MCRRAFSLVNNQTYTSEVPQSLARLQIRILYATASPHAAEVQRISKVPCRLDIFRKTHTASIDHVTFEVFYIYFQSFNCSNRSATINTAIRNRPNYFCGSVCVVLTDKLIASAQRSQHRERLRGWAT